MLWLGLSKICRIIVARENTLILFLLLEKMLSVFRHWEWCLLWVCYIRLLFCWGKFPLCPFCEELWFFFFFLVIKGFWVLSKGFFGIYLFFILLIHVSHWFVYIEESLYPWDKSLLIMTYDPFNVLLDSDSEYFVEDFCIYVQQWYWPLIFCLYNVWYQSGGGLVERAWDCSSLCNILEEFEKDGC